MQFFGTDPKLVFNKEVVPTSDSFTWQFQMNQAQDEPLQLQWPTIEKKGDRQLVLLDVASQRVIDMTEQHAMTISLPAKTLKIFFGDKQYIATSLEKELPVIGRPYPNPSSGEVNIPFYITDALDNAKVSLKVYNNLGTEVAMLSDANFSKGFHLVSWKPTEPKGLYVLSIKVGNGEEKRMKLILH